MGGVVEVRRPVDVAQLGTRLGNADVVQFCEPLTGVEYRSLAALLVDHPKVLLRAYGFNDGLATLRFLRWFPRLRRFSVAGLHDLTDLAPLDQLNAHLEFLDIGETRKPLDLAPVAAFHELRALRIVAHRRGLAELLNANPGLQALALWRLPVDQVLPVMALPHLQSRGSSLLPLINRHWSRAEIGGAGWEQTDALNGVEQRSTPLNGVQLHPPQPASSRFRRSESVQRPVSHGVLSGFAQQSTAFYVAWQGSMRRSQQ
ncbi:hypothetical protein ACH47V_32640 [Micromonospora chersina]|uniref:hypothetical protein n=1 Tax=Micromonospora chersina TaxID=47854 RepID=UPI00340D4302